MARKYVFLMIRMTPHFREQLRQIAQDRDMSMSKFVMSGLRPRVEGIMARRKKNKPTTTEEI